MTTKAAAGQDTTSEAIGLLTDLIDWTVKAIITEVGKNWLSFILGQIEEGSDFFRRRRYKGCVERAVEATPKPVLHLAHSTRRGSRLLRHQRPMDRLEVRNACSDHGRR